MKALPLLLIGCLPLLLSCETRPGYENFGEGVYLRHISFDVHEKREKGDQLLEVRGDYFLDSLRLKDNLFAYNEAGLDTIETTALKEPLRRALKNLQAGDSVHLLIDTQEGDPQEPVLPGRHQGVYEMRLKILHTEALPLSEGRRKEKEEEALMRYIKNSGKKWEAQESGIFICWIEKTGNPLPGPSSRLDLLYNGRFLNGRIFDDSRQRGQYLEYTPGTQNQLIRGLEIAVSLMPVGSRAEILIPWQLAFGAEGSSTGIVGPYKMVIFDLQLKNHPENES